MTSRISHTSFDSLNADEVTRLLALGAITVADPEGNEFCILRSDAELEAAGLSGLATG